MGKESDTEKKLGEFARARGCLYYKFSSPARRGVPDRLIIAPNGRCLFLELKAPKKTPTALQRREIELLRGNRQFAEWTDNLEEGKRMIETLCNADPV